MGFIALHHIKKKVILKYLQVIMYAVLKLTRHVYAKIVNETSHESRDEL